LALPIPHPPAITRLWRGPKAPHGVYVTAVIIKRLGEREITVLIDRVTRNKLLPENIRHDIIDRTDGIPLFIEEMTSAVLEAASEGGWEMEGP
jgi:predicted ATPase